MQTIQYLSVEQVLALHGALVRAFGGGAGLRDRGGLKAAVARPAATFGGEDVYDDLAAKAAALMHSLVLNHPFVDGNKRVGVAAAELFLSCNRQLLSATDDELEVLTLAVAQGAIEAEALAIWFRQRLHSE
jgi:death-on-curing protein